MAVRTKLLWFAVLTIITCSALWFSRNKIITFFFESALNKAQIERGIQLTYDNLTADSQSVEITNLSVKSDKFNFQSKSLKAKYNHKFLFKDDKIRFINDLSLKNYTVKFSPQPEDDIKDFPDRSRKLKPSITKAIQQINSSINLRQGRVILQKANKEHIIEVAEAILKPLPENGQFKFYVKSSDGILPHSSVEGSLSLSLPGFLSAKATINAIFMENQWQLEPLNIDGKWQTNGDFELNIEAHSSETTANANFQTNLFDQSLAILEVKTSPIELTREPEINRIFLSSSLLNYLGYDIKTILNENNIKGKAAIDGYFAYNSESTERNFNIKLDISDASVDYTHFPYPLDQLDGVINIDPKRLFMKLQTADEKQITVTAKTLLSSSNTNDKLDIRVTSPNLPVDERLYNALDDVSRSVWRSFEPEGTVEIDYHMYRNDQGKMSFNLDVIPLGGKICYDQFIYPIDNVYGKFTVTDKDVTLKNMRGTGETGTVMLNGKVSGFDNSGLDIRLDFECSNIKLNDTFRQALPSDAQKALKQLKMNNATADLSLQLTGKPNQPLSYAADMTIITDKLNINDLPVELTEVKADILLRSNTAVIKKMDARLNDQDITLSGVINMGNDKWDEYDLTFQAPSADFGKFVAIIPQAKDYNIKIDNEIAVKAEIKSNSAGQSDYDVELICSNNKIELKDSNIILDDADGVIKINEKFIDYDITAIMPALNGKVKSSGKLETQNPSKGIISVDITDIRDIKYLFPELKLTANSTFNLTLKDAFIDNTDIECKNTTLGFISAGIEETPISDATGFISGEISYSEDLGLSFNSALLKADQAIIYDIKAKKIEGYVNYDKLNGLSSKSPINAKVYDGDVIASFAIKPENNTLRNEISVDFHDIDVSKLFDMTLQNPAKTQFSINGTMTGQLYMQTTLGDDSPRTGRLEFEIQNAQVADKTVFDKIFDLILSRDQTHTMRSLKVDSYIQANTLELRDVEMLLPIMMLKGKGNIDLNSEQIDLTLTAHGFNIDLIGELSRLLWFDAIGKAIAKVQINGDLWLPNIEITTLGLFKR